MDIDIEKVRGSSCEDGTCLSLPLARNDLDLDFVLTEDLYFIICVFLIGRFNKFILALQIDPELKS